MPAKRRITQKQRYVLMDVRRTDRVGYSPSPGRLRDIETCVLKGWLRFEMHRHPGGFDMPRFHLTESGLEELELWNTELLLAREEIIEAPSTVVGKYDGWRRRTS